MVHASHFVSISRRSVLAALVFHAAALLILFAVIQDRVFRYPPAKPAITLILQNSSATGADPGVITHADEPRLQAPAITSPHLPASKTAPKAGDAHWHSKSNPKAILRSNQMLSGARPSVPLEEGETQPRVSDLSFSGGNIAAVPLSKINPAPIYPPDARQHGEEGRVLLSIHIMPDGKPSGIDVATSSGFRLLDKAAVKAVIQWQFQPACQNGKPVESNLPLWISFVLK